MQNIIRVIDSSIVKFTAALVLAGFAAVGARAAEPVKYLDWDAENHVMANAVCRAYEEVTADTATLEDGKWYIVTSEISRGTITVNGAAHLILCDGAKLTAAGESSFAGIDVSVGNALTIYGQAEGAGELVATSAFDGAGIGGGYEVAAGTITINGGKITARSEQFGAGIGGGTHRAGGTITINGGVINASSGHHGAGIGSGSLYMGKETHVTINGGTVTAHGGYNAAGIGGGQWTGGGTIAIGGGEIKAYGGEHGAGIGAGNRGVGDTLTITGGKILAVAGGGASPIGGGWSLDTGLPLDDGDVKISGGVFAMELKDAWIAKGYRVYPNTDVETKEAYPYAVEDGRIAYLDWDAESESLVEECCYDYRRGQN